MCKFGLWQINDTFWSGCLAVTLVHIRTKTVLYLVDWLHWWKGVFKGETGGILYDLLNFCFGLPPLRWSKPSFESIALQIFFLTYPDLHSAFLKHYVTLKKTCILFLQALMNCMIRWLMEKDFSDAMKDIYGVRLVVESSRTLVASIHCIWY